MKAKNGALSLSDEELEIISEEIRKGVNPLKALENEMNKNNIAFDDFADLQLSGSQLKNKKYVEAYAQMVCESWNN